jgi:hypothetical protein
VQVSKNKRDIDDGEIQELTRLAEKIGARPILVYKNGNRFESVDARDKNPIEW